MDWANEKYVRLYTRDTTTWKRLSWEGKALLPLLLRKVDRAGVLDLDGYGVEGVALHVECPIEWVRAGVESLASEGTITITDDALVIPNCLEAQSTRQSDKARAAESRENRRKSAIAKGVTRRHQASPGVTDASPDVTSGHSSCAVLDSADCILSGNPDDTQSASPPDPGPASGAGEPEQEPPPARPDKATQVCRDAVALLNELRGTRYRAAGKTVELVRARMREKATAADFEAVIRHKVKRWKGTEWEQYLRPSTLFAGKFWDYRGEAPDPEAGDGAPVGPGSPPQSPSAPQYRLPGETREEWYARIDAMAPEPKGLWDLESLMAGGSPYGDRQ